MKLDLVAINKLSPPGLWDLASLSAVISMLYGVVKARLGGSSAAILYMHMIAWNTKSLRDKTRENLGMRIKAWVMQCPARIIWVRSIIGEPAIRKWQKNRLADYALSKYFGDWKRKWPDGFKNNGFAHKTAEPRRLSMPRFKSTERAYNWQFFALKKIVNVEKFLYGRPVNNPDNSEIQAALQKLWNVDILDDTGLPAWTQPRAARILSPVEFTPRELVAEAATGTTQDGEALTGKIENPDDVIEEMGAKRLHAPPDIVPKEKNSEENKLKKIEQKPP